MDIEGFMMKKLQYKKQNKETLDSTKCLFILSSALA